MRGVRVGGVAPEGAVVTADAVELAEKGFPGRGERALMGNGERTVRTARTAPTGREVLRERVHE